MAEQRWIVWPVPERFGGGGFCVTHGEPDAKLHIGRQIGGVPPLSKEEAVAIAKVMNRREARKPAQEPAHG